jgi:hypothetical protein
MLFIRYLQLCWLILKVILFYSCPTRHPRGDLRNFARSFYVGYYSHRYFRKENA